MPAGSTLAGMDDIYGRLGVIGATVAGGYAELCLVPDTHVYEIPDAMSWHDAVAFPSAWLTAASRAVRAAGTSARGDGADPRRRQRRVRRQRSSSPSTPAPRCWRPPAPRRSARRRSPRRGPRGRQPHRRHFRVGPRGHRRRGVDMVFDHVGPALFAASLYSLSPRGRLVNCGNTTGDTATIPSLGHCSTWASRSSAPTPTATSEFAVPGPVHERRLRGRDRQRIPARRRRRGAAEVLANDVSARSCCDRSPHRAWPTRRTRS